MRQDNKILVKSFVDQVKQSEAVFVTGFTKMKESEIVELRCKLDEKSAYHKVIKNRLFKVIAEESNTISDSEKLSKLLKGQSAFTYGGKDIVSVAKVIVDFSKGHENFELKGGIVSGRLLSANEVKDLASLPSKNELIAKLVGTLAAPLSGIVGVLSANLRNLVGVVSAIKEKKESNN